MDFPGAEQGFFEKKPTIGFEDSVKDTGEKDRCDINKVKIEEIDIAEQFIDKDQVHDREAFTIKIEKYDDLCDENDVKPFYSSIKEEKPCLNEEKRQYISEEDICGKIVHSNSSQNNCHLYLDVDYLHSSLEIKSEDDSNSEHSGLSDAKNIQETQENDNTKVPNRKIRKKNTCLFCDCDVLNFVRHITRCHPEKPEVKEILSKPAKSSERLNLLTSLRKKGNYLKNSQACERPMKKSPFPNNEYLPCQYCLGFYSRKHIGRHKKNCGEKPKQEKKICPIPRLFFTNLDPDLRDRVFPRMRFDKVSITAQKDFLICTFGAQYFNQHPGNYFVTVTSSKMRELARILIEMKKLDKTINTMMDILKPKHYQTLLKAIRIVAKYDEAEGCFACPSFAVNVYTSLKQCCDIAVSYSAEKKNICEEDVKKFSELIEANWKNDISKPAWNTKKYNKIAIVPLAEDLKLLRSYLKFKADEAKKKLSQNDEDESAYRVLTETVYCRVSLLNRIKLGDLQKLSLNVYNRNLEQFPDFVTPTEKILMNRFKTVISGGIPLIFSDEIQQDISKMNEIRSNFIKVENRFLFAQPGRDSHIAGLKVLSKYFRACGAERYDAPASARLRKHLAVLSQIFSMTESDLKLLLSRIGQTRCILENSYRSPEDVCQSSRIVKILMRMEEGTSASLKGKSHDEIEVDSGHNLEEKLEPKEDIIAGGTSDDISMNYETMRSNSSTEIENEISIIEEKALECKGPKMTGRIQRTPWKEEQKRVVKEFFRSNIQNKIPPKRRECEKLISQNKKLLENKDWLKIKAFVQNVYTQKCKG